MLMTVIRESYNSDIRIVTASVRILEHYCTFLDKFICILDNLSRGDVSRTNEAMDDFGQTLGKLEPIIGNYFDHGQASEIISYRILRIYNV